MKDKRKKKKKIFGVFLEIIILLALIAIVYSVVVLPKYGATNVKHNVQTLNDGWKIIEEVIDNGDGTQTEIKKNLDESSFGNKFEQNSLLIAHDCDFIDFANCIAFSTYYNYVQVFINNELIYSYGYNVTEQGGEKVYEKADGLIGNAYVYVEIPYGTTKDDSIRVLFESKTNSICFFSFDIGDRLDLFEGQAMLMGTTMLTMLMVFFCFVLLLCMKLSKRTSRFISKSYFAFVNLMAMLVLWELLDSQILIMFGVPAGAVCFCSFEVYMLIALPLLQFTHSICYGKGFAKFVDFVLLLACLVNFGGTNFYYFTGRLEFFDMLFSSHIVNALILINSLIQVFVNWVRSHKRKYKDTEIARYKKMFSGLLVGDIIFCAACGFQYYEFLIEPANENTEYLKAGALVYGLFALLSIISHVNSDIDLEKKKTHDKLVEEKLKVEESKLIMQDAFKTIIPEKFIDDVISTYKKRRELQKENPDSDLSTEDMILKIGQAKIKDATILVSDVRGFSELSSKLDAIRLGKMLNHYLGSMTDIVEKYGGHVLEFMGDGILACFGTIEADDYNADKAVKAAIEMQLKMPDINKWNEQHGFPSTLEIGIGINTGEVFAGIIGSVEKFKYDVLGKEVNLASRIESFTFGGQILISESTKVRIHENIGVYDRITATPKGFDLAMTYYQIIGIGDMILPIKKEEFKYFENPINVKFNIFEGKGDAEKTRMGKVIAVCDTAIILETKAVLEVYDIVKVIHNGGVTCKVASIKEEGYVLRFTSTAQRNDGQAIFVEEYTPDYEKEGLDAETRKLMKDKKDNYSFK